ncbi:carboxypeptidase regulatory-like domain-containing protein [Sphingobacterium sp.]|uniref:carboxypeptidase regulatory-like domain-containing protein n=1 Tax=Sphingobacterium sp. TaxID=341027 RepID=UPI0028A6E96C|nr:carboxypeptidase regulatory-like domain-containing protein [Sphingobacterium sp.]
MTQKNRVFFGAKSLSLLAMCLLMSSPEVFAEKGDFAHSVVAVRQQTISGSVKDDAGNPIVGATVLVKGTTKATSTDANGDFQLLPTTATSLSFETLVIYPKKLRLQMPKISIFH